MNDLAEIPNVRIDGMIRVADVSPKGDCDERE